MITYQISLLFLSLLKCSQGTDQNTRPWLNGVKTPLPLLSKKKISQDTHTYTFSLSPSSSSNTDSSPLTLGIPICSCLLVSPVDNPSLVRPYTPVSSRHDVGSFTLLVKKYSNGAMGTAFEKLKTGDEMLFWQIPKNIKERYPFGTPKVLLMLAAGTGITPMYQALQRLFGTDENHPEPVESKIVLIYGSRTADNIFLGDELADMERRYPDNLEVVHVLSDEEPDNTCANRRVVYGQIDEDVIKNVLGNDFDTDEARVWVCGPPGFYDDMCGPRDEEDVSGVLKTLGMEHSVVKF